MEGSRSHERCLSQRHQPQLSGTTLHSRKQDSRSKFPQPNSRTDVHNRSHWPIRIQNPIQRVFKRYPSIRRTITKDEDTKESANCSTYEVPIVHQPKHRKLELFALGRSPPRLSRTYHHRNIRCFLAQHSRPTEQLASRLPSSFFLLPTSK